MCWTELCTLFNCDTTSSSSLSGITAVCVIVACAMLTERVPVQVVDLGGKAAAVAPAASRPARRAAVAAKATYKEELSSEEEEAESDDAEGDSDFEASD